MRKSYRQYNKKEEGYIFPYLLLIITLLMLFLMNEIRLYEVNQQTVLSHAEQYRLKSLYRLASNQFELEEKRPDRTLYSFPDGEVEITYQNSTDNEANYIVGITTLEGSYQQKIIQKPIERNEEIIE
ncbi:hypothetical protein [Gracilibacillus xinjiangensis]|uniref:Competence protein ComG n=1 Tax=Gracilibacillus xinjiangensis TaxID=1193282 RepID=A0ABV8WY60_9BACI